MYSFFYNSTFMHLKNKKQHIKIQFWTGNNAINTTYVLI